MRALSLYGSDGICGVEDKCAGHGREAEIEHDIEEDRNDDMRGEPHVVMLLDELGEEIPESLRLARDVLVWEERGRTVRLEGDLTLDEALELADAMR